MAYGVTPEGFVAKSLELILEEIQDEQRAQISSTLNTASSTPIGQLNGIFSDKIAELWEVVEELATAQTRGGASGFFLDYIGALTGSERDGSSKSLVVCTLNLGAGAEFEAGELIAAVDGDASARFVLAADVSNPGGAAADVDALFEAETEGPVRANAGTLTVRVTPLTGWNSVTNDEDAEEGQLIEEDGIYRNRQVEELPGLGSASCDALSAKLLKLVGMQSVLTTENNTDDTVGGLPPHSFEAVVFDGDVPALDDDVIAQVIWDNKGQGTRTHGDIDAEAADSKGVVKAIKFSRAESLDMYLEIDLVVDPNLFPENGTTLVKEAIANYGDANLFVGTEVVMARLYDPIFSVQGVLDVPEIRIGTAPSPVSTDNFTPTTRQICDFDTGRTEVNVG